MFKKVFAVCDNPNSLSVDFNMQFQHITFNTPAYRQMLELRDIILRQPLGLSLFDD